MKREFRNNAEVRCCFREPISEILDAANFLDTAVSAHLIGDFQTTEQLIRLADMPEIREWTESIWGANSPYVQYRLVSDSAPILSKEQRVEVRMPSAEERQYLHSRDGYHCRFCGIPVIRKQVRKQIISTYPSALKWSCQNIMQHSAFQAMWMQYDRILPHSRGGTNDLENVVVTCAPCNFGRMNYTLAEVGLLDLRLRKPIQSKWDGLERFL
jgi:hypothetical protein